MSLEKGNKKIIRSWMMYDWANSVYNLVISSAIFPIFYESITSNPEFSTRKMVNGHEQVFIQAFGYEFINTSLVTYVGALGFLIVAFISPLLSGVADYIGRKKMFMRIFVYLGSFSCMGLYFFGVKNIEWSFLFYILALIGFWGSLVFYNAYLPEIAEKKDHDKISAGGFSLGYLGSVTLLAFILVMISYYDSFGFQHDMIVDEILVHGKTKATQFAFFLTGLWWFGFSHIFFANVRDSKEKYKVSSKVFWNGFKEMRSVFNEFKKHVRLQVFLPAFFMISTGVQTVMIVAVYFAAKVIFIGQYAESKSTGLIISILLIQFIAIPGALGMAKVSKKIGNIPSLQIILLAWIGTLVYTYFIQTPNEFYIAASLVGMVMGSVQALSRSTYSKMLPVTEDTSSYFSFYDVTEKLAIVLGMFIFGFMEQITGSMRNSILAIIVFFIAGLIILNFVPKEKNKTKKE